MLMISARGFMKAVKNGNIFAIYAFWSFQLVKKPWKLSSAQFYFDPMYNLY